MEFLVVAGVVGLSVLATQNRTRDYTFGEKNAMSLKNTLHKDNSEVGIHWGNQRALDLNLTNLNSANMPYSAPTQRTTYNYDDIAEDQADRSMFVQVHNPPFFFRHNDEIPYTTAAAHVYNIEIPSCESIRGDDNATLCTHPRSYIDLAPGKKGDFLFAGDLGTTGAMGAGESEVWYERDNPPTGQLNFDGNPYGPGGTVQRLFNNQNENITRLRGTNRATLIGPPTFATTTS